MRNAEANPSAVSTLVEPAFVLNSFLPSGLLLFPVFCFQQYFQPCFPVPGLLLFLFLTFQQYFQPCFLVLGLLLFLLSAFQQYFQPCLFSSGLLIFPVLCFSVVFPALFCWPNLDLSDIQSKMYPKLFRQLGRPLSTHSGCIYGGRIRLSITL